MRAFCTCGHSEAWHSGPTRATEAEQFVRAISFFPMRGAACDICDCAGYERRFAYEARR